VEQFLIATAAVGQEGSALTRGKLGGGVKEFLELGPALAVHEVKAVCTPARLVWAGASRLSRFSIVRMGVEDGGPSRIQYAFGAMPDAGNMHRVVLQGEKDAVVACA
jgi:hypothetical protein